MTRGILDAQVPRLRETYAHKCEVMADALARQAGDLVRWAPPRGGFFLWVTLPEGVDARAMLRAAIDAQVIFVDGTGANCLRLAFSSASLPRIEEGIARLAGVIRTAAEASGRPAPQASR